jgi:hypothetical protein
LDAIVGEVRSSLEYLLSQSGTGKFEQVLVTGGGAMLAGVTEALSTAVGLPVKLAELPFAVDKKALGLSGDALTESSYRWLTACGLALWGTDVYGSPTLLPPEVVAKRQQRRVVAGAVGGVVLVAACLGGVSFSRVHTADGIASQISRDNLEAVALQGKIKALGYVLEVPAEVQSRRALAVAALIGDIDWTGLLQRLAAALPGDVKLGQISLTKNEAGLGAGVPVAGSIVGSVAMSAETTGGATAVAQFIDQVSRVKGLYALWVSSTTKATGQTTIQATAQVTTAAFSNRAAALPGGTK